MSLSDQLIARHGDPVHIARPRLYGDVWFGEHREHLLLLCHSYGCQLEDLGLVHVEARGLQIKHNHQGPHHGCCYGAV